MCPSRGGSLDSKLVRHRLTAGSAGADLDLAVFSCGGLEVASDVVLLEDEEMRGRSFGGVMKGYESFQKAYFDVELPEMVNT